MNRSIFLTHKEVRTAFILLVLFCLLNAYQLTNFNVSIDDEVMYHGAVCAYADVGRWLIPLLLAGIWRQPVVPAAPLLIFGTLFAIAFIYLMRLFRFERVTGFVLMAFAVYATYPVWLTQMAFSPNVIPIGIGVFCVSWAALRTVSNASAWRSRSFWLGTVLPASLGCAVALGAYQSLALLYLVLVLGAGLAAQQRSQAQTHAFPLVRLMTLAVVTLLIAAAFSWVAARVAMTSCSVGFSPYGKQYVNYLQGLLHPIELIRSMVKDGASMYFRAWRAIGVAAITFGMTLLVSFVVCVLCAPKGKRLFRALWALLLIFLPTMFSLISGGRMPLRTFIGAAGVMCLLLMLAYTSSANWPLLRRVVSAMAILTALQGMYVNAIAQARSWAVARHDQALAAAIYGELVRQNGAGGTQEHPIRVHFSGVQPFGADAKYGCDFLKHYFPIAFSTTTGASFFSWDGGNTGRIVDFMNLLGYTDVAYFGADPKQAADAVLAGMPTWPASGSVVHFGEGFLVKLSPPIWVCAY